MGGELGYIIIYRMDLKQFIHVKQMYKPPLEDYELALSKNKTPVHTHKHHIVHTFHHLNGGKLIQIL